MLAVAVNAPILELPESVWTSLVSLMGVLGGDVWQIALAVFAALLMVWLIGRLV